MITEEVEIALGTVHRVQGEDVPGSMHRDVEHQIEVRHIGHEAKPSVAQLVT